MLVLKRFRLRAFALLTAVLIGLPNAEAQFGGFGGGGFSSASVSTVRSGICPPPEAIVVEEFYNYHFHDIPSPEGGEAIHLDARWGSPITNNLQRHAYLQIGLATKRDIDLANVHPLNISFVIDRSGSMQGDRIANVKKSLLAAFAKFRKTDRVSVVTFDTEAETIVASQPVTNLRAIRSAIRGVEVGGSTNLCAGLMLGYQNVQQHLDPRHNNRVILLTDGNANQGIIDSEEIARKSIEFNQAGIDLSTIGLGQDFNHALIRRLARSGRGLVHFVGDEQDIEKVFVDELDGLLAGVARNVSVAVDHSKGLTLHHVYGYSPKVGPNSVQFSLDPLNSGTTQVLLLRFRIPDTKRRSRSFPLSVRLTYDDIATGETETVRSNVDLVFKRNSRQAIDPLTDVSVRRNVTISDIAQGIKGMSELLVERKTKKAKSLLTSRLALAADRYPIAVDAEVRRTRELAVGYLQKFGAD